MYMYIYVYIYIHIYKNAPSSPPSTAALILSAASAVALSHQRTTSVVTHPHGSAGRAAPSDPMREIHMAGVSPNPPNPNLTLFVESRSGTRTASVVTHPHGSAGRAAPSDPVTEIHFNAIELFPRVNPINRREAPSLRDSLLPPPPPPPPPPTPPPPPAACQSTDPTPSGERHPVRLSDSTVEFSCNRNDDTILRKSLRYLSKAN